MVVVISYPPSTISQLPPSEPESLDLTAHKHNIQKQDNITFLPPLIFSQCLSHNRKEIIMHIDSLQEDAEHVKHLIVLIIASVPLLPGLARIL